MPDHETTTHPDSDHDADVAPHAASKPHPHHRNAKKLAENTRLLTQQAAAAKVESDAGTTVYLASEILDGRYSLMGAPASTVSTLQKLRAAATGKLGERPEPGAQRVADYETAEMELRSSIAKFSEDRPTSEAREWLQDRVVSRLEFLRSSVNNAAAIERVKHASLVGEHGVYDAAGVADPEMEVASLRQSLAEVSKAATAISEFLVSSKHIGLYEAAKVELATHAHGKHAHVFGSLEQMQGICQLLTGLLELSPEEFRHHLAEANSLVGDVKSLAELASATTDLVAGAASTLATIGSLAANAMGNAHLAASLKQMAGASSMVGSKVVSVLVVVLDVFALFSAKSNAEIVVDGVALASHVFVAAGELGIADVPAAWPVAIGVSILRKTVEQIGNTELGIAMGMLKTPLEHLFARAESLTTSREVLEKAQRLVHVRQSIDQMAAMSRMVAAYAHQLGESVDALINEVAAPEMEAGMANHAGSYGILRDALAQVVPLRGARTPAAALRAASVASERLMWVMTHVAEIVKAAALGDDYKSIETQEDPHDAE